MNEEQIKKHIGNKVQIHLKSGYKYTGRIIKIENSTLLMIDKFNEEVSIAPESIITIIKLGDSN